MSKYDTTSTDVSSEELLVVNELKKYFPVKGGILKRRIDDVKAVDGVSFELQAGETLGLVGESGCGKSTLGRTLLRLLEPTAGDVYFEGTDLSTLSSSEMQERRKDLQIIFQDPASSLNPRMSVADTIKEPMHALTDWSSDRKEERTRELIEEVGLSQDHLTRAPHEFSGGQQQRIAIARALSVNPKLIIADEPTSALDVSVQAKILNLMQELQEEYGLTYLFISHDLSVVKHVSDRIAVMYLGELVEVGQTNQLFSNPKHPYTKSLLSSIPTIEIGSLTDRIALEGEVPSPQNPPSGCRFHTRCQEYIGDICEEDSPELVDVDNNHYCSCHHYG